jgi:hypothetical protein
MTTARSGASKPRSAVARRFWLEAMSMRAARGHLGTLAQMTHTFPPFGGNVPVICAATEHNGTMCRLCHLCQEA